ncbi:hypothetical protein IEQ34_018287 [Dendrobium chrysotoxum]|uniref:Uncharacterized protein n=1 Tax=Dendrobium chrysotoxum TaxID=161865 RepID=A0AAV7GF07_DENCH|nr:hypothetical protein IEQ34_018287 [Dendrobium chrysotoxum]
MVVGGRWLAMAIVVDECCGSWWWSTIVIASNGSVGSDRRPIVSFGGPPLLLPASMTTSTRAPAASWHRLLSKLKLLACMPRLVLFYIAAQRIGFNNSPSWFEAYFWDNLFRAVSFYSNKEQVYLMMHNIFFIALTPYKLARKVTKSSKFNIMKYFIFHGNTLIRTYESYWKFQNFNLMMIF